MARVFDESSPPLVLRERELVFDALRKLVAYPTSITKDRRARAANADDSAAEDASKQQLLPRGTFVMSFGQASRRQQARNHKQLGTPQVIPTLSNRVVRSISCGATFTAAVTDNGQVWTWGDSKPEALGTPADPSLKHQPRLVEVCEA